MGSIYCHDLTLAMSSIDTLTLRWMQFENGIWMGGYTNIWCSVAGQ